MLSDRERQEAEREARDSVTSAALSGGAADWKRTASVGEEAAGGGVAIPDQSDVDDLGSALGVPRAPDEELRTSREILEGRDRDRWDQES